MRAARTNRRGGATLLEVLMAIMILGIGLVSVASLFPISVIRSTQANYLTHATTHRYNAEMIFKTFPHMLRDPDNGDQNGDGNNFNDQQGLNYLIDPLALSQNSPIKGNTIVGQMYRYDGFSINAAVPNPGNSRLNLPSDAVADWLAASPDTWKTRYEGMGTNLQTPAGGPQSLTVSGLSSQNVYAQSNGTLLVRALIFNTAGTVSESRILTAALNGNGAAMTDTISWATNLPNSYAGNIGKVLIQTQAREFSWVATIRNQNSSTPDVTIAVFHNRDMDPNRDIAYANLTNTADQHLDNNNNPAQQVFYQGFSIAYVSWAAGSPAPYLKKGGWMLDTDNGFWYQIESFVLGANQAQIVLDSPAKADSDPQTAVAVFPRGIVDVFPIGAVK